MWLPTNYDKNHAYPTIFVGPGCGGKGNNSIQPQTATGNDAIIIGLDYNSTAIAPREVITLKIAASDVPAAYEKLRKIFDKVKVRIFTGR